MYILVDALDELDARTRQDLLAYLRLALGSHNGVKLLVTSRDVPGDESVASMTQIIEIFAHQHDLLAVIDAELKREGNETFRRSISGRPSRNPGLTTLEQEIFVEVAIAAKEMYAGP